MKTGGAGKADIDVARLLNVLTELPDKDWGEVVLMSKKTLASLDAIGASSITAPEGTYSGAVVAKDGEEVALKFFAFGPDSDTPLHTHSTGCGSVNVGNCVLYNINFKVLLKDPIAHRHSIQVTSIDIMEPGGSMVDHDRLIDDCHGHAIVNPSSDKTGHAVHPYHLGAAVGIHCANKTIYIDNSTIRTFMERLKGAPLEEVKRLEGSMMAAEASPAVAASGEGRKHFVELANNSSNVARCIG